MALLLQCIAAPRRFPISREGRYSRRHITKPAAGRANCSYAHSTRSFSGGVPASRFPSVILTKRATRATLCHPDRSERSSRRGRISDSFAQAKPVPVPSRRPSVILTEASDARATKVSRRQRSRSGPLSAGVTPAFAQAKPVPVPSRCFQINPRGRCVRFRTRASPL